MWSCEAVISGWHADAQAHLDRQTHMHPQAQEPADADAPAPPSPARCGQDLAQQDGATFSDSFWSPVTASSPSALWAPGAA